MNSASRYSKLMGFYWAAVYAQSEEERALKPSDAVLEACAVAKRVITKEVRECGYQETTGRND